MNQHTDTTPSKQVRTSGPSEPCDHCGAETRPPDVRREGATTTRYLHVNCATSDGIGEVNDAHDARRLQAGQGRGQLRVVSA